MEQLKTVLLCFFGAVVFGVLHDLITANLCVEYFTIAHPKLIESQNPVLLALVWGVTATWWVGLFLGILMVLFNSVGKSAKVTFSKVKRYVIRLLLIIPLTSLLAGLIGYILASLQVIYLAEEFALTIAPEKHSIFLAVAWSHVSSYLVGLIGGIVICMKIWMQRTYPKRKMSRS